MEQVNSLAPQTSAQTDAPAEKKKMVVGWFSFTCCEDSTILFTELLNKHFDSWRTLVEFRHLKALKTTNELRDLDVAFVEGAVSAKPQEDEVKKIRENSKYVVAIGSCACNGMPSASRNLFTEDNMTDRIKWYFEQFAYDQKVRKLDEVIQVDDKVDGCPMNTDLFLETLMKYLKIYNLA